jgi:hypothetical protein
MRRLMGAQELIEGALVESFCYDRAHEASSVPVVK